MAKRTLIGPPAIIGLTSNVGFNTFALDTTTKKIEFIVQADEAATITHLGFRYATPTGTPPTYQISAQGVTATGEPDGTIKASGAALATFTPPATSAWNNTWQWIALGTSFTVGRGEIFSIVIEYASGTVSGSANGSFTTDFAGWTTRMAFPYSIQNTAGTRARRVNFPSYGFKSATTSYGFPLSTFPETQFSSGSSPNEYALKYVPQTAMKVVGAYILMRTPAAGKSFSVNLYTGTTVIQTITMDSDYAGMAVSTQGTLWRVLFSNTTLTSLSAGTPVYLSVKPLEADTVCGLPMLQAASAQDLNALGGEGDAILATRAGGAWTDVPAQRPMIMLIVEDISLPSDADIANAVWTYGNRTLT